MLSTKQFDISGRVCSCFRLNWREIRRSWLADDPRPLNGKLYNYLVAGKLLNYVVDLVVVELDEQS